MREDIAAKARRTPAADRWNAEAKVSIILRDAAETMLEDPINVLAATTAALAELSTAKE